jgi:chemotaxis protein CheY-P-specific phosphatase CheC
MQVGLTLDQGRTTGECLHNLTQWRPSWNAQRTIVMTTRIEGGCQGPFHVIFPEKIAWELVRAVLCLPNSSKLDRSGLNEEHLEVFMEMMNLLCGSYNSVFEQLHRELKVSQAVGDLKLYPLPRNGVLSKDLAHIDRGLAIASEVTLNGKDFEVVQLMPIPLARAITNYFTLDVQGAQ